MKGKIPSEKLISMANIFDVSIDYLLGRTERRNYSQPNKPHRVKLNERSINMQNKKKPYRTRDILTQLVIIQFVAIINTLTMFVTMLDKGMINLIVQIFCITVYFALFMWLMFVMNKLHPGIFDVKFDDENKKENEQ